jgi:hypothetical protein
MMITLFPHSDVLHLNAYRLAVHYGRVCENVTVVTKEPCRSSRSLKLAYVCKVKIWRWLVFMVLCSDDLVLAKLSNITCNDGALGIPDDHLQMCCRCCLHLATWFDEKLMSRLKFETWLLLPSRREFSAFFVSYTKLAKIWYESGLEDVE